jgi:CDP-2,3-bis-(O-geranylgeranyl)-sn-glycerol synthase
MESIVSDLIWIIPLHITNALVFLIMRFGLLGSLQKKDFFISEKYFGTHKTFFGGFLFFSISMLLYFILFSLILPIVCIFALLGTHINSFLKRRLGINEGGSLPFFDQLDFTIGGIVGLFLSGIYISNIMAVLIFSGILHVFTNAFAYFIGIREKFW